MANTGNGENENTAVKPATAESSLHSPKIEKKSTRKTKEPITKEEAAELLTSALSYCLEAGIPVIGYNEGTSLRLSIDGLEYANDKIQPINTINVTQVTLSPVEQ